MRSGWPPISTASARHPPPQPSPPTRQSNRSFWTRANADDQGFRWLGPAHVVAGYLLALPFRQGAREAREFQQTSTGDIKRDDFRSESRVVIASAAKQSRSGAKTWIASSP